MPHETLVVAKERDQSIFTANYMLNSMLNTLRKTDLCIITSQFLLKVYIYKFKGLRTCLIEFLYVTEN